MQLVKLMSYRVHPTSTSYSATPDLGFIYFSNYLTSNIYEINTADYSFTEITVSGSSNQNRFVTMFKNNLYFSSKFSSIGKV
mmetsp:Transcript_26215/g.23199  ORF Transcript_26215/g.23199 Transcript_26215/m.23199 type:complete len:82 (+) Transcript_26215:229-474(+)